MHAWMTMGNSEHQANGHDNDLRVDSCWNLSVKPTLLFVVCFVGSLLFCLLKDQSTQNVWTVFDYKPLKKDPGQNRPQQVEVGRDHKLSGGPLPEGLDKKSSPNRDAEENHTRPVEFQQDYKFLGGLIAKGFDEKSCLSRYHYSFWSNRKGPQTHRPSSHLISRLRSYEARHRRCGPHTKSFERAVEHLKSGNYYYNNYSSDDCKYLVWIGHDGLGNRMITLVSAFLYALLTHKVLLVDPVAHISDLFCEPFPGTSWLIPSDFPTSIMKRFRSFHENSPETYGNMLMRKEVFGISSNRSLIQPAFVYLYLVHNYGDDDKHFFCDDEDQTVLKKVPWLVTKSNIYHVPSLFLMSSFQKELGDLFPEKETVFHFLGRYLFHPTNSVWRSITRYYEAHLARADENIGIQIRIFQTVPDPFDKYLNQILTCVIKNHLLPQINENKTGNILPSGSKSNKTISVLMTSLSPRYHDAVKERYEKHPTATGETIRVHQPSNEVHQNTENRVHNVKAWEEMYLLSLTDKLVTSSKSTFGYVAQSLGGLKPWILYKPEHYQAPNPACQRAGSMEPCCHAPSMLDCKTRERIDPGQVVGYVRHCEDMGWTRGLKIFDKRDDDR